MSANINTTCPTCRTGLTSSRETLLSSLILDRLCQAYKRWCHLTLKARLLPWDQAAKGTPKLMKSYDREKHEIVYYFVKMSKKGDTTVRRNQPRGKPCQACVEREASGEGNGGCHSHDDSTSSQ